jgi:hypothetical protein
VDWEGLTRPDWTGNEAREVYIFIKAGKGLGQYRRIRHYQDRELEIDRPWDVPPDNTSEIVLAGCHEHNLVIGNEFHDGAIVQSWFMGIDWIVSGNNILRGGGMHNVAHDITPSWYFQYIENEITVGSGTRSPHNKQPPRDSHLGVVGQYAMGTVFRRNVLHNNARIAVGRDGVNSPPGVRRDMVIDRNIIRDADVGIIVSGSSEGVLIWNNRFERVKEPLVGIGDAVFMHPAERLLNYLSAEGVVPSGLQASPDWKAAIKQLHVLHARDPASDEMLEKVRTCQDKLARAAAATPAEGQSLELIRVLTGLTLMEDPSVELQSLLAAGTGGTAGTKFLVSLPEWSVPVNFSLTLPPLKGWHSTSPASLGLKPGESIAVRVTLTIPAGIWGKPTIPVSCTINKQEWQLSGSGSIQLASQGRIPTELVNQWMVVGPFVSDQPGTLGDTIYPPQRSPDVTAEYSGSEGSVGWKQMKTGTIDFSKLYGQIPNGVAFAMTVLRVTRPTSVAITNPAREAVTWLNGEMIGLPFYYRDANIKVSRTLEAGDHVILCGVPQTVDRRTKEAGDWKLGLQIEVDPQSTPGDVQVLPAEEISSIPVIKPQAIR